MNERRFSLGANYWSRAGGPRMWTQFSPRVVREELEAARDMGLDTLRFFLYWPDFEPQPGVDNPVVWEKVAAFLDMADRVGLDTFPTLLVGHMSGRNWDPPWREGRDLWTDPWMVAHEEAFIRRSVTLLQALPRVAGWVLTNEWPLYAGLTTPPIFQAWIRRMTRAVREHDASQRPISMGDGLWNAMGSQNGIPLQQLEDWVDIVGPHVYPESSDALEVAMASYVHCALAQGKRSVLLEEFGTTEAFGPEAGQAAFYRSQLAGALAARAEGAWAWCLTDFDLSTSMPYSHHPFELKFGLMTTDGRKKATAHVLREFGQAVEHFGEIDRDPVGVVVPALQTGLVPLRGPEPDLMTRVAARFLRSLGTLGYNPGVIREPIPPDTGIEQTVPNGIDLAPYRALFLAAPRIGEPFRQRLWDWVADGGHLYMAYSWTFWFPDLPKLLGLQQAGLYNVQEYRVGPQQVRGEIAATIQTAGRMPFVTVTPAGARAVAHLDGGEPFWLRLSWGEGTITTCTLGAEAVPDAVEGLAGLYGGYLEQVGLRPAIAIAGSEGQVARSTTGRVMAMNHGGSDLVLTPTVGHLRELGGSALGQVHVEPHQWWFGEHMV